MKYDNYQIIYPHLWNQYSAHFQKYIAYENKFVMIGAISTLWIYIFFSFPIQKFPIQNRAYYLPLVFLLIPFFITIFNFFYSKFKIKAATIPWVGRDILESELSEGTNTFFKRQIDHIYYCADEMFRYMRFATKCITVSLVSMVIGIFYYIVALYFYCPNP